MSDDLSALFAQATQSPEYDAYRRAQKMANSASPIDIPKADGLLAHAEKILKSTLASYIPDPQQAEAVLRMLMAQK